MNNSENDIDDYRNKILALLSNLKFGDSFDKNAFSAISSLERGPTIDILISIGSSQS